MLDFVFVEKILCYYCVLLWVNMCYLFEYAGVLMSDASQSIQDLRRPFSNCKPNKEWAHIALHCYNENEIDFVVWNS